MLAVGSAGSAIEHAAVTNATRSDRGRFVCWAHIHTADADATASKRAREQVELGLVWTQQQLASTPRKQHYIVELEGATFRPTFRLVMH